MYYRMFDKRDQISPYPWLFLALTLGLTWFLEFLAAGFGGVLPTWGVSVLRYLGGVIPITVAVGLVYLKHDRTFQRDYWRRIFDFRRISLAWYALIFLFAPLKSLLAALIDIFLGGAAML
jgi:hypothetical protein